MTWQQSPLTWPLSAQEIQTRAEVVTSKIASEANQAAGRLTALKDKANYQRDALSTDAESLLTLRAELNALLTIGTVLTVSPYQYDVADSIGLDSYLSATNAVKTLTSKLRDHADKHRPNGRLYCIAIMVNKPQLSEFAQALTELVNVFNLPDWAQVARQATALTTNETDKFIQPTAIIQPRFKPMAKLNSAPVRQLLKAQGAQVSTLESLADDKDTVIDKLQLLAQKRAGKLNQISNQINTLKALKGSVFSMAVSGTTETIASTLTQTKLPSDHQYTVASLLLSHEPLTFWEELLC